MICSMFVHISFVTCFKFKYMVGMSYKWCLIGDLRALKFASEPITRPGVPADPCERAAPMFFISEPFAYVPSPI